MYSKAAEPVCIPVLYWWEVCIFPEIMTDDGDTGGGNLGATEVKVLHNYIRINSVNEQPTRGSGGTYCLLGR